MRVSVLIGTCLLLLLLVWRLNSPMVFTNQGAGNLQIPKIVIDHDQDGDGLQDWEDILEGARQDARNKPVYRSAYYRGGYPPDDEGVCTDVIWRAFKNAGYDLKKMVDEDIKNNVTSYPRVEGKPDPNIDFRRVPNLKTFFDRKATALTIEIIPNNPENLKQWQPGDIVIFGKPIDHIGIISDIRRRDGVPYLIHNGGPYTKEEDMLIDWDQNISPIIGHYRWPKKVSTDSRVGP
jgi:uncharacterized protein YijF (DUF1287 family)